jgi:Cellulase (glycosyl hydrolase family 5)
LIKIFFIFLLIFLAGNVLGFSPSENVPGVPSSGWNPIGTNLPAGGIFGVRVSGNKIVSTQTGSPVQLLGVATSGFEQGGTAYNTSPGATYGTSPTDAGFSKLATMNMNVLRIPLNAETWLGVNGCIGDSGTSAVLQANLQQIVANANAKGLYVILDLHWTAPNAFTKPGLTGCPAGQPGMPDADHTISFWTSIAGMFKNNPAVMFELFNEPYGSNNFSNSIEAIGGSAPSGQSATDLSIMLNGGTYNQFYFQCNWGCTGGESVGTIYSQAINPYTVTGTQAIVTAIRGTGATNVIIAPTMYYGGQIQTWLSSMPTDSLQQLVAAWHEDGGTTASANAVLSASYPIIITEAYNCTAGASQCVASNETISGTSYSNIANGYLDSSSVNVFNWAMTNQVGIVYWVWASYGGLFSDVTNYTLTPLGITLKYAYCLQPVVNSAASCP